ncbi:MAG: hypothetical protein WC640_03575 [Candidatus Paceibacterota bacterium]|jgi:hypothetical protein
MAEFESPLSESLSDGSKRAGREKLEEELEVVDLEFKDDQGVTSYRKIFKGGTVGLWSTTNISSASPIEMVRAEMRRLRRENDLPTLEQN